MARHICVSVVTRHRPLMLRKLFESFKRMRRPLEVTISFLIVENDPIQNLTELVEALRTEMPRDQIIYRNESTVGISSARNHALEYALKNNFDYLII
ncbi:hypothetical protein ACI2JN_24415 [Ochrobactrum teleogrylli]|uniref:hypothetical protein n=1 Tax=Ochrobactrum teleogrylli TaxID=2479765 RepID=UPI00384F9EE7